MSLQNTSMNIGQTENVQAIPEDASANAGLLQVNTNPTWTPSPSGIVQVNVAANGLSANVTALAPGSATITVAGTNSAGAAISSQFVVNVQEAPATQFGFTFGTPTG